MLLAADIGNTNITLGVFSGAKLLKQYRILTKERAYLPALKRIFSGNSISGAVICSVVPEKTNALAKDLFALLGKRPAIIGRGFPVPIKNCYRKPKQVGQDRLVNAYAGITLFGAPLVVVDFGTAITFDVISRKKEYLGGMIVPGLNISLDSLAQRTALLPKVSLGDPKEFIGKDTRSSMRSGIIYGFAALTDDLTKRIQEEIGKDAKVIGTGGNIGLIGKYCKNISCIDSSLTLKGLNLLYHAR